MQLEFLCLGLIPLQYLLLLLATDLLVTWPCLTADSQFCPALNSILLVSDLAWRPTSALTIISHYPCPSHDKRLWFHWPNVPQMVLKSMNLYGLTESIAYGQALERAAHYHVSISGWTWRSVLGFLSDLILILALLAQTTTWIFTLEQHLLHPCPIPEVCLAPRLYKTAAAAASFQF